MTIQTVTDVKSGLDDLKKDVRAVTKADKAWLSALETFFEGIDPKITDTTTTQGEINNKVAKAYVPGTLPIDQVVRVVLDDVSFLQYTDKKLDARVSQSGPTSEDLGRAVVEAEAYLLLTNEAFVSLQGVSTHIVGSPTTTDKNFENFKNNLGRLNSPADSARTGLTSQVGTLLQQTTAVVTLPPTEPEGTDLLLGRKLSGCAEIFIKQIPLGSKEYHQTVALLEGGHLTLSNSQIRKLIGSWEKAIKAFVQSQILPIASGTLNPQQAFNQEFGSLDTIAGFLCVHNVLDTLYDRLETKVTRTVEIISTDI
ncbi:MAG: hypothetical protein ACJ8CB_30585 [Ktedonobacteraceae bacterium]